MRTALLGLLAAGAVFSCSSPDVPASTTTSSDTPTFHDDVYPIVLKNCSLTACHGSKQSHLNIYLPNGEDDIYSAFQGTSPTTGKPFVKPGNPDGSYVMNKMDGKQTQGTEMPPGAILSSTDRDTVRAWIKAGAKKD